MGKPGRKTSKDWRTARRWTGEQARAALAALASSGESVAGFAARHGLDAQRLYGWRRRIGAGRGAEVQFVEVTGSTRGGSRGDAFEIVLRSGDVVLVPQTFDAAALARLVATLRGSSC